MSTKSYKELIVWQKSKDLAVEIYKLTANFPAEEKFGITSQMRRASISISSNIAEGYHRFHSKDKKHFLVIAFGSASELESQIEVSKALFPSNDYTTSESLLNEALRMLNKMITLENGK